MLRRLMLLLSFLIIFNNLKCPMQYDARSQNRRANGFKLIYYIRSNRFSQALGIINYNTDINVRDDELKTPLVYAILFRRIGLAAQLIYAKADLNAKDIFGITALRLARELKMEEIVQILVAHGAQE